MKQALKWFVGIMAVFVVVGVLTTPSEEEQAIEAKTAAVAPKEWVKVAEWQGSSRKNTEDFTITGDQWRITWAAKPQRPTGGSAFAVMVMQGGRRVGMAANISNQEGADVDYQRTKGVHHLEVRGLNVGWAVTVEEER